jgi:hypothetical protein
VIRSESPSAAASVMASAKIIARENDGPEARRWNILTDVMTLTPTWMRAASLS